MNYVANCYENETDSRGIVCLCGLNYVFKFVVLSFAAHIFVLRMHVLLIKFI